MPTATEWAGVAFALSLIVCTSQGFKLFNKLFQYQGNTHDNNREDNLEIIYIKTMVKKMMIVKVAMTVTTTLSMKVSQMMMEYETKL